MNDITRAALIFNAASIPLSFFTKLCNDYDPHEIFSGSIFLRELGLSDAQISQVNSQNMNLEPITFLEDTQS